MLKIYRWHLQGILLQAPLISRLSINTTKSFYIAYAVLTVAASSVSTNSIKRFFLAPIWLCGSRACSSTVSAIQSAITLSKILLRVFSKAIGRQFPRIKQSALPSFHKITIVIDLLSHRQQPIAKHTLAISISQGAISSLQVFRALFKILFSFSTILFKRRLIVLVISLVIILLLTLK